MKRVRLEATLITFARGSKRQLLTKRHFLHWGDLEIIFSAIILLTTTYIVQINQYFGYDVFTVQILKMDNFLTDSLFWIFFFILCCLSHIVLSVSCSIVVTCWERADFLALLYVMFSCVFVIFPYGILGQVWYLIVSIPDL